MHMIADLLAGFPNFLLYFSVSIIFVLAFKFIYVKLTPYDEWHLIKEKQNTAAAIALSGALLQCWRRSLHLRLYVLFYFQK